MVKRFLNGLICLVVVIGAIHQTCSKKTKRDIDMNAGLCVIMCINNFNMSAFTGRKEAAGSPICRHADMTQLDAVCDMYKNSKDCLKRACVGMPLVDMILRVGGYACDQHYEEFKKYTPCFAEACPQMENSCKTKCGSISEAIKYTPEQQRKLDQIRRISEQRNQQETNPASSDSSDSSQSSESDRALSGGIDLLRHVNLEGACRYANCYLNCSEAPLTEKCGTDTYNFFKRFVVEITPLAFEGLFPNITTPPQECQMMLNTSKQEQSVLTGDHATTKSGGISNTLSNWVILAIVMTSFFVRSMGNKVADND